MDPTDAARKVERETAAVSKAAEALLALLTNETIESLELTPSDIAALTDALSTAAAAVDMVADALDEKAVNYLIAVRS